MRAPSIRPYKVYCGNFACEHRLAGRLFTVIDTTDMTDGERAGLLIEGADSFKWVENEDGKRERVRTSKSKPRFDGELTDGVLWICPDCQAAS